MAKASAAVALVACLLGCSSDPGVKSGPPPPAAELKRGSPAWLARQCDGGHGEACAALAGAFREGDGVRTDQARALALYERACDLGTPGGCLGAALTIRMGVGVQRDLRRIVTNYKRACDLEVPQSAIRLIIAEGCRMLGQLYAEGVAPVEKDPLAGAMYLRRACELGDGFGCTKLADMHKDGSGVERDQVRAAALYQRACELDWTWGCLGLGDMLYLGKGVAEDLPRARSINADACTGEVKAKGGPVDRDQREKYIAVIRDIACTTLGAMTAAGEGGPADPAAAAKLLHGPCSRGVPRACGILGGLFLIGAGVPLDMDRAIELLRPACADSNKFTCAKLFSALCDPARPQRDCKEGVAALRHACNAQNEAQACSALGEALAHGLAGVQRDPTEAAAALSKGCPAAPSACGTLGELYLLGDGVEQDVVKGMGLIQQACRDGWQPSCEQEAKLLKSRSRR